LLRDTRTSDAHRSLCFSLAARLSACSADRPSDLPSSWTTLCLRAVLSDPGGADAHAVGTSSLPFVPLLLPSALRIASATTIAYISRFHHTARRLAVYASQPTSPSSTQDSLPAGGTPWPDETQPSGSRIGQF